MNCFIYIIFWILWKKLTKDIAFIEAYHPISLAILICHQVLQLFEICWLSNFENQLSNGPQNHTVSI